jgi:intron-binding protein aquarius
VVSLYQYMRLRGYPANKIAILTTYNGQKALLRDVIENRCARHPAFGRPSKVRASQNPQSSETAPYTMNLQLDDSVAA